VSTFTAIEVDKLPAPDIFEQRTFESIYAERLAEFRRLCPEYTAIVESDPVIKILQGSAYREMLLREQFTRPLPRCREGHQPRYMVDGRRLGANGGHFVECRCVRTERCASFDLAWAHWHKLQGTQPLHTQHAAQVVVPQLQLRLVGGTQR